MSAEDVNRILGGIVILVIGVAILNVMFSSSELDSMAEQSASGVADAINEAALLPTVDTEPTLEQTDKYVPFMVRFGEPINFLSAWTVTWQGARPSYEIYYEKFPDDTPLGFFTMWTESYPWSGGMGQQLGMYVLMRSATLGLGTKTGRKVTGAITGTVAYPLKGIYMAGRFARTIPARIVLSMEKKNKVYGTWLLMRFTKYHSGSILRKSVLDNLMDNTFGKLKTTFIRKNVLKNAIKNGFEEATDATEKAKIMRKTLFGSSENSFPEINGKLTPPYNSLDKIREMKVAISLMDLKTKAKFLEVIEAPPTEIGFKFKPYAEWLRGLDVWKPGNKIGDAILVGKKITNFGKYATSKFREGIRWIKHGGPTLNPSATKNFYEIYFESTTTAFKRARRAYIDSLPAGANKPKAIRNGDIITKLVKERDIAITFPKGTTGAKYITLTNYMDDINSYGDYIHLKNGVTFEQLKTTDPTIYNGIISKANAHGLTESDASKIWEIARKNYANDGGSSIEKAGMKVYINEAVGVTYDEITGTYVNKNPEMLTELENVIAGRFETNPKVTLASRRVQRAILFDYGKYKTIITTGAAITQESEEATTTNYDGSTDNSIVFVKKGSVESVIPLNAEVANYGVKIDRQKPSGWEVRPWGPQSALFYASVVNNPRYYTVSPCFGIGKAWKGIDENGATRIFVKMDNEGSMCAGKECNPGEDDCNPEDCANYCYATTDRLFGNDANEPGDAAMGAAIASAVGCYLIPGTQITGTGCLMLGSGVGYGVLAGLMATHQDDTPCTDKYWSYWNWYVASDTMDNLEMMLTSGFGTGVSVAKDAKFLAKTKNVISRGTKNMVTDLSLIPQTLGDAIASWPNIGYTKYGISKEHIEENQAECVWGTPEDEQARKNIYGSGTDVGSQIG